jgi:DNA-binding GntR family transcriptional regulator
MMRGGRSHRAPLRAASHSPAKASAARASRKLGSIVDTITDGVRRRIREGRFAPGQRLVETDLQTIFGVSRGPVREAIRRLGSEGLLDIRHNVGAMVRSLSRDEVRKVFRVREVLEGLAARMVAEKAGDGEDVSILSELERRFEKDFDGTAASYMAYNDQFHQTIIKLGGNEHLIEMAHRLQVRVYRLQAEHLNSSEAFRRSRAEHKSILSALRSGDGDKAERLMRKHVRQRLPQILEDKSDYFA